VECSSEVNCHRSKTLSSSVDLFHGRRPDRFFASRPPARAASASLLWLELELEFDFSSIDNRQTTLNISAHHSHRSADINNGMKQSDVDLNRSILSWMASLAGCLNDEYIIQQTSYKLCESTASIESERHETQTCGYSFGKFIRRSKQFSSTVLYLSWSLHIKQSPHSRGKIDQPKCQRFSLLTRTQCWKLRIHCQRPGRRHP
jgi:hypothetical protein